jgi:hypothetical protein
VIHALQESSEFATHLRFFTGVSRPRSVSALDDFQHTHIAPMRSVYDLSFNSISERRDQGDNEGRARSVVRGVFARATCTVQLALVVLGHVGPNWFNHVKEDGVHPS